MGNYKRKFIFVFTTLISILFLNNLEVHAITLTNRLLINSTQMNTSTRLYTSGAQNMDLLIKSSDSSVVDHNLPQYGYIALCNAKGSSRSKYIDTVSSNLVTDLAVINSTVGCTIPGSSSYIDTARVMYITYKIPYTNYNCGNGSGVCYWINNISLAWWEPPGSNEYSLISYGFSYDPYNFNDTVDPSVLQNDSIINNGNETNDKLDEQIEQNKEIINQQKETNDYITDDTEPNADISALGNVQGLLPEGPVDSLLNIPFMFLSVITSSMGGVCVPMEFNFVFDSSLTLPCFSEQFYGNVPDLLLNFLSLIPSAFILIKYFKYLYKKVDRAVSMDSNADDQWGAI